MFLCNILHSKCGKQCISVIVVLFLLIRSKRNVYSMWNELDVGDV